MYRINEEELNEIKEKFKEIISYSQEIAQPKVDKLFDLWLENKKSYIELFDGKLIYELPEPVSFEMTEKDKKSKFEDFLTSMDTYVNTNNDFVDFLEFERDGFFSNTVCEEYRTRTGEKIPKGMKLVKAFKYFIEDKELLTELQMEASRIIQKDKITGRLCFSVHPLDFLSSSENAHNWRSCHALDGEYRSGNLSYMVDSSTIIVYLKSDEDAVLPNFPPSIKWNNKKWRMLLFLSNDWAMAFAGRQYPFSSDTALTLIKSMFLDRKIGERYRTELFGEQYWSDWDNSYITNFKNLNNDKIYLTDRYLVLNYKLVPMRSLITDKSELHYNDLLHSSYYIPFYTYRKTFSSNYGKNTTHFDIGGEVPCLYCENSNLFHPQSMLCYDHEMEFGILEDGFIICDFCGERIPESEANFLLSGYRICNSCLENEDIAVCAECGEMDRKSDLIYDEISEEWYCKYCFDRLSRE